MVDQCLPFRRFESKILDLEIAIAFGDRNGISVSPVTPIAELNQQVLLIVVARYHIFGQLLNQRITGEATEDKDSSDGKPSAEYRMNANTHLFDRFAVLLALGVGFVVEGGARHVSRRLY